LSSAEGFSADMFLLLTDYPGWEINIVCTIKKIAQHWDLVADQEGEKLDASESQR
jgi:hypothetical protein